MTRQRGELSPLGLRSRHDVVDEMLDGLTAAGGIGSLGVLALGSQRSSREQHLAACDVEDLDVYGDLETPPRRCRLRADANGNVRLILGNRAANDGIGLVLRRVANAEA